MNKKLKLEELNRISIDEFKSATKTPLVIILNNIRSLQNVGSFFRTADAFRCKEIWLQGITGVPPHREIHKTALGATLSVSWRYFEDELEVLKEAEKQHLTLVNIEQTLNSVSLNEFKVEPSKSYGIIFGNEVEGVSEKFIEIVKDAIEIPQLGTKHSLNVTISGGIVIWELFNKLK